MLPFLLLGGLLAAGLLYWLLIATEGVYLGRRVVVWLYDLTAGRYDRIKQFDPAAERLALSGYFLAELAGRPDAWLLDVATGSGRAPLALLGDGRFLGRAVGLDASGPMLAQAQAKLARLDPDARGRCLWVRQYAGRLPFAAASFSAVICLEALEFFPSDRAALAEMARVLRPGGLLLVSRRKGLAGRLFLGRYRSAEALASTLAELGLVAIKSHLWQLNYDLVSARQPAAGPAANPNSGQHSRRM
ncbi:MAG: class I SAM-dependent methyltransferase [Candidatus Promineifilaceae bacterium]